MKLPSTYTFDGLAQYYSRGQYDVDFTHYPGKRYRCVPRTDNTVRVYEDGAVMFVGHFGNNPDLRASISYALGIDVVHIDEYRGKLFTPDGTKVAKNQLLCKHLIIDNGVALAAELYDRNEYDRLGGPLRRGNNQARIVWPAPSALPYSTIDAYLSVPDEVKLAEVSTVIASHHTILLATGAMEMADKPGAITASNRLNNIDFLFKRMIVDRVTTAELLPSAYYFATETPDGRERWRGLIRRHCKKLRTERWLRSAA